MAVVAYKYLVKEEGDCLLGVFITGTIEPYLTIRCSDMYIMQAARLQGVQLKTGR